jgi:hypothetical protein
MRRTNIYLSDEQLDTLRALADQRGEPVAELVRQAVDEWLAGQGVRLVREDEWAQRFESLLARRRQVTKGRAWSPEQIERDVGLAVAEVRKARGARRR